MKHPGELDTIVALSSPPGPSLMAVIRASGPDAIRIVESLFEPDSPPGAAGLAGFSTRSGRWRAGDLRIPGVLYVMRSPRSYTGEDMFEFHMPGSVPLVKRVLESSLEAGARAAGPGEFTRRAYLSGRIDLTQAEAVMDFIRARSDSEHRRMLAVLGGALSRRIREFVAGLAEAQSLLVASVDFCDQALGEDTVREARRRLEAIRSGLSDSGVAGLEPVAADRGLRVLLVGRTSAGKSTLFNRLLGRDRAIESSLPGTTRDLLEEEVELRGVRFVLVDGAGWREDGESRRHVEVSAEERSRRARETSDLFLHVVDGSAPPREEDRRLHRELSNRAILCVNKRDLETWDAEAIRAALDAPADRAVSISARTGEGMGDLVDRVVALAAGGSVTIGTTALANARQTAAVAAARRFVEDAIGALDAPDHGPEFATVDLESALGALGEIVGEVTSERILDLVFGRFCIGK